MFAALFNPQRRRRNLAAKAPPGPLRDFLNTAAPSGRDDIHAAPYLAVDLETTGLEARNDEILSMGWVPMQGLRIDLSGAEHRLVRATGPIPEETAVIHRITDDAAAGGDPLETVLGELLTALAGRVLIAHHANMELGFLDAACRKVYGLGLWVPAIDTLRLAQETFARRNQTVRNGDLRLDAMRQRYNLPRYRAHDALSDALAAAELFAAQASERSGGQPMALKTLLMRT